MGSIVAISSMGIGPFFCFPYCEVDQELCHKYIHEETLRFQVYGHWRGEHCCKIPHSFQERWCGWHQVNLETFGLSGIKREGWKRGKLAYDETVMMSQVFPVFRWEAGIEVPPFEKRGGKRDLKARFFSMKTSQASWDRSLLFTLHIH
jgi:hypothetical protein